MNFAKSAFVPRPKLRANCKHISFRPLRLASIKTTASVLPSRPILFEVDMPPPYKINLIDHDRWVSTGYNRSFAWGLVVTDTAQEIGFWRVVRYNPNMDTEGGCYEFSLEKTGHAIVSEEFSFLDSEISRGRALSDFVAQILNWEKSLKS